MNQDLFDKLSLQKQYFEQGNTLDVNQRIALLKKFSLILHKYEKELLDALYDDRWRDQTVGYFSELLLVYDEIKNFIKHLKHWTKDKKVKPFILLFHKKAKLTYNPYGQVYLITPFNFPILLSLQPLVGAIGAGNVVFLKLPSVSINVNKVIKKIISESFDEKQIIVWDQKSTSVEQEAINSYKWDFIFFTGSQQTAAKIYSYQYNNFVPAVFELGGKSPMIIDDTCDLKLAAIKYLNTKLINAGQICVAADYLLIKQNILESFLKTLQEVYKNYASKQTYLNGKLVSEQKIQDTNEWINKQDISKFKLLDYRDVNQHQEVKIALIDYQDTKDKAFLEQEMFCPITYYDTFNTNEELFNLIQKHPYPLVLYCFSQNKAFIELLKIKTQSGAFVVNDTLVHVFHANLPFGGIRNSGLGQYHGKTSFLAFSHAKPYLASKWYGDKILDENKLFDDNFWLTKLIKSKNKK